MEEYRTKEIKRYKEFNQTIIALVVAMMILPFIVKIIRFIFPDAIRCFYYELTGDPCPFCGFTSDIRNILRGNIFAYKNNLMSVPFILIGILEFVSRVYIIKHKLKKNNDSIKSLEKNDLIIHVVIGIFVLIYMIVFFVFDIRRF